MSNTILFLVSFSFFFIACGGDTAVNYKKEGDVLIPLRKLEGQWRDSGTSTAETWRSSGDSIFTGLGIDLSNNGFRVVENIRIKKINNEFYYGVTTSQENHGKEVLFKMVSYDKNRMLFENRDHDFPNLIEYKFKNNDLLLDAIVSGKNGKTLNFGFTRIN